MKDEKFREDFPVLGPTLHHMSLYFFNFMPMTFGKAQKFMLLSLG